MRKTKILKKEAIIKTIQCSLSIGENDLKRKIKQAEKFLIKKQQVRVAITMHGRQFLHPERAITFLDRIKEDLSEVGTPANTPTEKNMAIVFNPKSK